VTERETARETERERLTKRVGKWGGGRERDLMCFADTIRIAQRILRMWMKTRYGVAMISRLLKMIGLFCRI